MKQWASRRSQEARSKLQQNSDRLRNTEHQSGHQLLTACDNSTPTVYTWAERAREQVFDSNAARLHHEAQLPADSEEPYQGVDFGHFAAVPKGDFNNFDPKAARGVLVAPLPNRQRS
jgi:hypothetical protein